MAKTKNQVSTFDNINRERYYGLRIGDLVFHHYQESAGICEVIDYGLDNNRVTVRAKDGTETDWVAEWCDLVKKVEDRDMGIRLVPDAYNLLTQTLKEKYWPGLKWHHDDPQCGKAVYQVELLNNGCTSIGDLEKNLAKLCKAPLAEIKKLVSNYYELS